MPSWRRLLILSHRYLGIALSIVFVCWFASGFAIIYTGGMPRLTEADRLSALPPLNLESIDVSLAAAQSIAATNSLPTVTTVLDRPAYRFTNQSGAVVFADNGDRLVQSMVSSQQIVSAFLAIESDQVRRIGTVDEVDQWTIGLRSRLPLEKFSVSDGLGSELYVSQRTAEVVLHTTSRDRLLAWIGAIPHWLYFLPLRQNTETWSAVVIWLSTLGTLLALIGVVLLFTQLRWRYWPKLRQAIPYHGVMRWHYITGIVFGIFVVTWTFSGLLSMDPYAWNRQAGLVVNLSQESDFGSADFGALTSASWQAGLPSLVDGQPIKELVLKQTGNNPLVELIVADPASTWRHRNILVSAQAPGQLFPGLSEENLIAQITNAVDVDVMEANVLDEYDSYYYSRESSAGPAAPLPVLRVKFDDRLNTFYYFDLATGETVRRLHRWNRLERWLYNGFHSLDFKFWYSARPLWDVGVWVLLIGGLCLSVLGLILGFRRILPSDRSAAVRR